MTRAVKLVKSVRTLSRVEWADFARLEKAIEPHIDSFLQVAEALTEIRERRLYRDTHESFEQYCWMRWGFSRQRAHQLIQGGQVARLVDEPLSEREARALAPYRDDPENLRLLVESADQLAEAKGEKRTLRHVKRAVGQQYAQEAAEMLRRQQREITSTNADFVKMRFAVGVMLVRQSWHELSEPERERIRDYDRSLHAVIGES